MKKGGVNIRYDNIYNHDYFDVIAMYPSLAESLTPEQFEERKADHTKINKIYYYAYVRFDKQANKYKAGLSRYDDKRQDRDFTTLLYSDSLQELTKYIEECIREDRELENIQRIEVTCNRNILDPQSKTAKKKYSVTHDLFTLYVLADKRLFTNYECFYDYFD